MLTKFFLLAAVVACTAGLAVYAWSSVPDLKDNHTRIYKRTPALVLVITIVLIGTAGIDTIATGILSGDFHLTLG